MFKERRERAHALLKRAGYETGGSVDTDYQASKDRVVREKRATRDADDAQAGAESQYPAGKYLEHRIGVMGLDRTQDSDNPDRDNYRRPARKSGGRTLGRIGKDDGGGVDNDLDADDTGMKSGGKAHPGFKAVQGKIEGEGYSAKAAGAILASSTRNASKGAKKANPRLNRVT